MSATMSSIDHSRSESPAAIAGLVRSVLCMRTKLYHTAYKSDHVRVVADRDAEYALALMDDLRSRVTARILNRATFTPQLPPWQGDFREH